MGSESYSPALLDRLHARWRSRADHSRHRPSSQRITDGNAQSITDTLKKVEAAGFSEVILYFNVGLKPHAQVKEEMDRFMREVAPNFQGKHNERRKAA